MDFAIKTSFFALILFIMQPASSYADWQDHDSGHHGFDHHSSIGFNFSVWPDNYYYYGAPYYYPPADEVLVSPPVYEQPVTVVQPQEVIAPAPTTADTTDSITINIPNDQGRYTAVTLRRSGNGYIGPQGEFYPEFPRVSQLRVIYGK